MTDKQPRLLTPRQRWLRGIVGVALILLYPSCHLVRFYWDTEAGYEHVPEMLSGLEQIPLSIGSGSIQCGKRLDVRQSVVNRADRVRVYLSMCKAVTFSDEGIFGDRYLMWNLDLEVTRPYRELRATLRAAEDYVDSEWDKGVWEKCNEAPPDKVPELEAKMAAVAKRHAAKLRSYLPHVRELAAQHERMRPVLAGLAWTLLLIEIAGGFSLLALGWGWMIRRGRDRPPPPREDPHWRTTEAGEQAPRTSPWFLALILLGALGTTALMMLAQRC